MSNRTSILVWMGLVSLCVPTGLTLAQGDAAGKAPKKKRPDIYDRTANGDKQISDGLAIAKRDHKRVLLQFGANWCGWCHKLHELFKADKEIAHLLHYEYEVVLIDVDTVDGEKHNADIDLRYGHPTKLGLPVLIVLDADGKVLVTQETGALEEGDHHNPAKVLSFLEKWQGESPSAERVLSTALDRAGSESRKLFVYFSAPWCGYCRKLEAYLHRPEIASVFGAGFIPVKIDVDRMSGGKLMDSKYRQKTGGGIPYFVVLDSAGEKLADSRLEDGTNVGFPVEPHEIAHFMKVVRQHAPSFSADDFSILEAGLRKKNRTTQ